MFDEREAKDNETIISKPVLIHETYGLSLESTYRLAAKYYREKEKSGELQIPYESRLKFMALSKQIRSGPYNQANDESGWFDLVGNDRAKAWKNLGDLSTEISMCSFVSLLDSVCSPFNDYVKNYAETQKEQLEKNNVQLHQQAKPEKVIGNSVDPERLEAQRRQIQEALNQQTYHQFRAYAQQQFVGDPIQQEALIKQLQEQHYQQYMAQVYAQQAKMTSALSDHAQSGNDQQNTDTAHVNETVCEHKGDDESDLSDEEPGHDLPSNPAIAPASMWNRQDIADFKSKIRKDAAESIIKVGHGETVTVRVPTHEEGSCLFWEFATDYYDIGFGVFFEWTVAESNQVSVHIAESSEDEFDVDLSQEVRASESGDVETGRLRQIKSRDPNKPRLDEIVPIYRRDCHDEVYAGNHVYPGKGVYLLKFDNSYSLWRSKTLYYRVYYSR